MAGWLIRYTATKATVNVPGVGERTVKHHETFEVPPRSDVRAAIADPEQPWERIFPDDEAYVAPEDR